MILLDANVIIDSFKPEHSKLRERLLRSGEILGCSDMVRLEVMGFQALADYEKEELRNFFSSVSVVPINPKIIDLAIELRHRTRIKSPDAIIVATALLANQPLWTYNTQDFKNIAGLELISQ